MYGSGLKTHIIITLTLLLGAAMVLANIVIVFLWQQNIIQSEANRLLTTLQITVQNYQSGTFGPENQTPSYLYEQLTDILAPECLSIQLSDNRKLISTGACSHIQELDAALSHSIQSGTPLAKAIGSTWAVFSLRPEYILVAIPVNNDSFSGGVGIVSSLQPMYDSLRRKQKIIFAYLLVNVILLTVIGFFRLVKTTVKPVERLVRMTEEYDESNDFPLFSSSDGNEFGQLTASLNRMTQRIEEDRRQLRETVRSLESANKQLQQTQKEMIKTEKLAAVGRLSAGLAHEIGNPIGIIQGYLELLQKVSLAPEDRQQYSHRAIEELNRINQLIRQLLDFARSSSSGNKKVRINHLVKDIVDVFKARKNMGNSISFHLALDAEKDEVFADEEGLRQVFLNCLINAVDAIGENVPEKAGEITIKTRADDVALPPDTVELSIIDNGAGIDPAFLNNIFDPFFTTKEPGKGTGLGLSVSYTIVEAAGGTFDVKSIASEGTEMIITLPLANTTDPG